MKKLVAESIQEYRGSDEQDINEGLFTSLKTDIDKFLQNPTDEKKANALIHTAFVKQINQNPALEKYLQKQPLDTRVGILTQASKKLEDKTIGVLKLLKTPDGKLKVGGVQLMGHTGGGMKA